MDPVAAAILLTIAVLWLAYGVGLFREWLVLRRTRGRAVYVPIERWWVADPAADEDRRFLN